MRIRTDQVRRLKELEKEKQRLKKLVADLSLDNSILRETVRGKLNQPGQTQASSGARPGSVSVSERRVCRQWNNLAPPAPTMGKTDNEELLTERIVTLASQYGRYGYRRLQQLLQMKAGKVNHKRVERIWPSGRVESTQETAQTGQIVAETMVPACGLRRKS